jgi:hypothetical protein
MAKKKGIVAAAAAFAASPQGRRLIAQAKDYASRPENKEKARQLIQQAKDRRKSGTSSSAPARRPADTYGTPPR